MKTFGARSNHLRTGREHGPFRVTYAELFFDLVFAFAITQLSHGLLAHLDAGGALQVTLLMLAMWWVWITTSWMTNWLDPEHQPVRLALLALMAAGMIVSSSITQAFGDRAVPFAWAYVTLQVGRTLFIIWSLRHHRPANFRSFLRTLAWLLPASALWIAGAHGAPEWRLVVWGAALFIEAGSPWWGYWTPGLGRSKTSDWDIEGGHLAERCALFIMIALGESILVTGSTFTGMPWTPNVMAAFGLAFLGCVAMWRIYFAIGAERGSRFISRSRDPGRLARSVYTYLHVPIVAGIVVAAVGYELALSHPAGHTDRATLAAIVGGPALYLLGNAMFKGATSPRVPVSHLVGLAMLGLLAFVWPHAAPLLLLLGTTIVLMIVAAFERLSINRAESNRRERWG
jgi:low temperature requirement protein LtrA